MSEHTLRKETARGVEIRVLRPEDPKDLEIARTLDAASTEALNPFDGSHDVMTTEQLKKWMQDSHTSMLRVIFKDNKPMGFSYLYTDAKDPDFLRRASRARWNDVINRPDEVKVWELNFWVYEETNDRTVANGVRSTLAEFASRKKSEKVVVMFADQGDMKAAYAEGKGSDSAKASDLRTASGREFAEAFFQDTRVLEQLLGFKYAGRIRYEEGPRNAPQDFMYVQRI